MISKYLTLRIFIHINRYCSPFSEVYETKLSAAEDPVRFHVDYRIKGHTPLGVSFTLPLPPTLLNLVPVFREITPGSMLNLLISTSTLGVPLWSSTFHSYVTKEIRDQ